MSADDVTQLPEDKDAPAHPHGPDGFHPKKISKTDPKKVEYYYRNRKFLVPREWIVTMDRDDINSYLDEVHFADDDAFWLEHQEEERRRYGGRYPTSGW